MNRKGAIELSANFIIIMIISMVILVGGLGLFFKIQKNAQQYVDTLDGQTEDKLKSIMLSSNYKVAVYPQDPIIGPGDAVMVGVGIKNNYPLEKTFTVQLLSVKKYTKANPNGIEVSSGELPKYYTLNTPTVKISPNTQSVKGVLLRMPDSDKGEYVYTIKITTLVGTVQTEYGVVQVYAKN